MTNFILISLATFGMAALITGYDGPASILARLREKSEVFRCTVCLSVWIAIPVCMIAALGGMVVISILAVIGAVILIERLT
jgi:hypothetical protein